MIFDLDGVIVSTDECHYLAWKKLAEDENIYFDRAMNSRFRGVSRMECLDYLLETANKSYFEAEKSELAERKNNYYRELIKDLSSEDILPGVMDFLKELKASGIKLAIGSSSKNSGMILERIGLGRFFDATADGNEIIKSKPDPEVFLLAAKKLNIEPGSCIVVEDAEAGIEAALAAGMKVIGVGNAKSLKKATITIKDMTELNVKKLLKIGGEEKCQDQYLPI